MPSAYGSPLNRPLAGAEVAITAPARAPTISSVPPASASTAPRPAIIAGRGAVEADAGGTLEIVGALAGAVMATSAPANGLFSGLPYALGISGGFASPLAAELLGQADAVIAFG